MKNKFLLLSTFVCLFVFSACDRRPSDGGKVAELKSVTIGSYYQAVDYAPYLIAKEKKWFDKTFEDEGIKVIYNTFTDLAVINDAFLKGDLDVIFEAAPPAIVSESAKVGIDILNISCSLIQEVIVRTDSDIRSIEDLRGKKIAVFSGSSSHYGILKLLKDKGIAESEVQIMDMGPVDAKVAFETGQIDAWAVWPPFVEQQEINGKGRVLPKGDVYIHSIMAVREGLVNEYPQIYVQIDSVFDKSKEWIINNPEEAITIVAKSLNMDRKIVEKAWPRHDWRVKLNNEIVEDVQKKALFLNASGKLQSTLDVSKDLIPKKSFE